MIAKLIQLLSNYIRIQRWILIERDLNEEIVPVTAKIPAGIQHDALEATVAYIKQIFYTGKLDEEEQKEIKLAKIHGHFFPHLTQDGRIICMQKAGSGKVYIRSLRKVYRLPENLLFTYAFYTDPQFRGKGLAPQLMTRTLEIARQKGYRYVRGQLSPTNSASRRMHFKCGFYEVSRFWHLRFFLWDFATADIAKVKTSHRISLGD